jgi:predicted glycoside hydrolase/deacetylase ChbG (UPF0249 family)
MRDRVLIINADDLGYDPAVTKGILEAMRGGIVSSATMMVNSPHARDAAGRCAGLSIGLHFNIDRFTPAWKQFPAELLRDGNLAGSLASELPAEVVEREALAQLDLFEAMLGRPATHLDSHKHLHRWSAVLDGVCAAAKARGLPVRSINDQMRESIRARGIPTPDGFVGDAASDPYWTFARLTAAFEALPEGITELMCHPGHAPVATQSTYAQQREVELQTFMHPGAAALLRRSSVRLADFTAVHG